jgi:hypothetical protein
VAGELNWDNRSMTELRLDVKSTRMGGNLQKMALMPDSCCSANMAHPIATTAPKEQTHNQVGEAGTGWQCAMISASYHNLSDATRWKRHYCQDRVNRIYGFSLHLR